MGGEETVSNVLKGLMEGLKI